MKPGKESSEFKLSALVIVLVAFVGVAVAAGWIPPEAVKTLETLGITAGGVTALYTGGRSYVKGKNGKE